VYIVHLHLFILQTLLSRLRNEEVQQAIHNVLFLLNGKAVFKYA